MVALFAEYMKDNYNNHYYFKACNLERTARQAYDEVLCKYDVMVMPTIPFKAQKLPTKDRTGCGMYEHKKQI